MSRIEPLPDEPRALSSPARPLLLLLVTVALLRGLLYLAVVPPWQHYDEPTHFEYVRLIAERGRLPHPGDYDLEMRRAIAVSMQATGLWELINEQPPDLTSDVAPDAAGAVTDPCRCRLVIGCRFLCDQEHGWQYSRRPPISPGPGFAATPPASLDMGRTGPRDRCPSAGCIQLDSAGSPLVQ